MQLPDELDADLLDILGRPNFTCGAIAHAMRDAGTEIPRKAEAEQAHVLFKLVGFYAEHGQMWRKAAADWIEGLQNAQRAKNPTGLLAKDPHPHP